LINVFLALFASYGWLDEAWITKWFVCYKYPVNASLVHYKSGAGSLKISPTATLMLNLKV